MVQVKIKFLLPKIKFPLHNFIPIIIVIITVNYRRHFRALSPSLSVINMSDCSGGGNYY